MGRRRLVLRRELNIKRQLKCIINHSWQQLPQQSARLLKARVCIDFNKPGAKLLIDHEVIAHDLERVLLLVWVESTTVYAL